MADETAATVCEAFDRLTAGNPRFIAAPRTKQARWRLSVLVRLLLPFEDKLTTAILDD